MSQAIALRLNAFGLDGLTLVPVDVPAPGPYEVSVKLTAASLNSVVYTHSVLVAQGVDADLHVWEGVGHGFFYDPDLPESQEAYAVIVRFFDTHVGRR
jgi:monoterpene epsilon-lactone hydrolase